MKMFADEFDILEVFPRHKAKPVVHIVRRRHQLRDFFIRFSSLDKWRHLFEHLVQIRLEPRDARQVRRRPVPANHIIGFITLNDRQNLAQSLDFLRRRFARNQAPTEQIGDVQNPGVRKIQNRVPRRVRSADPAHLDFALMVAAKHQHVGIHDVGPPVPIPGRIRARLMSNDRRAFAFPLRVARDMIGVPVRRHNVFEVLPRRLFDEAAHNVGLIGFFERINDGGAAPQIAPRDVVHGDAHPHAIAKFFHFVFVEFVSVHSAQSLKGLAQSPI